MALRRLALSLCFGVLAFALACAAARATTMVSLQADHIEFYYDRFLIEADGNVRIQTSDGFTASGQAFSMDLKLNRFLLAGNVALHSRGQSANGAAIADFLDFDRIYFVPVTTAPDRWTFLNRDLAHPVKGRVMPGDAFYFPDLGNAVPSLTARSAVIGTKTYVRFAGATGNLVGLGVPLGSYVVNFSSNQYFAQNSLSGANFDATWNFAGSPNALSALHLRSDQENGVYLAFEQHLIGDHEYAIFSVNPLTKYGRFWNLDLYEKLGNRFQIQTFTQLYTAQYIGLPPRASTQTTYVNAIQAFEHSYLQISANLTNYNLLGSGAYKPLPEQPPIAGNMSHPTQMQATWTQFQTRVAKLPLYEQVYGGYGFNHDSVGALQYDQVKPPIPVPGLQTFGAPCANQPQKGTTYFCPVYTTIYNTVAGINLFTPSIKIGDKDNPYRTFYVNASFNKQRQWNSLPHYIDNTTTSVSLSRQFSRPVNAYVNYTVQNTGDYYKQGGYVPCNPLSTPAPAAIADARPTTAPSPTPTPAPVPNASCPPSLQAFRGVATLRTFSVGVNYVPAPEFNTSLLYRHHADFPIAVPGVFALPTTNVIGQPLTGVYLGQPPNDITADVRFKFLPHLQADVSRTYYFHFGTTNWSPKFVVLITPI